MYKLNILIYYYCIIILLKFLYFVKILFLWCLSYNSGVSIAFFGTTVQVSHSEIKIRLGGGLGGLTFLLFPAAFYLTVS